MTNLPATTQLDLELAQDWLTIWLNRPESRNALTAEMVDELTAVLAAVHDNRLIRGITFRGRGGVFCAGGDIKGFKAIFQGTAKHDEVAAASRAAGEFFGAINRTPQVVIMLVEGAAMAGGMGMVCGGDIVLATRTAKFGLTETTLGIPPAQIAPFVIKRLGLPAARRLMLTARRFDGSEALTLGLVDELAENAAELEIREKKYRQAVSRCAPGANAITKEIILASSQLDREAMVQYAGDAFAGCILGEEGMEGVSAFVEKRKPRWQT